VAVSLERFRSRSDANGDYPGLPRPIGYESPRPIARLERQAIDDIHSFDDVADDRKSPVELGTIGEADIELAIPRIRVAATRDADSAAGVMEVARFKGHRLPRPAGAIELRIAALNDMSGLDPNDRKSVIKVSGSQSPKVSDRDWRLLGPERDNNPTRCELQFHLRPWFGHCRTVQHHC